MLGSKHLARRRIDPHSQSLLVCYRCRSYQGQLCYELETLLPALTPIFLFSSKPKLTKKEEIPQKSENIVVVSPPVLASPSPYSFSLPKSFVLPYQDRENLLCRKQEDLNVGGSSHTRVLEEQPGTGLAGGVPRWERCCLEALPSGSAEDQKTGVIQGGEKEQMPKLKAKRRPADVSVCVNVCRSTKDVENKPLLPVVSVLKAATGGEAPIQLCPFGWQQRLHKLKVEKASHLGDGDRGGKELQVLNKQEQEGMTEQEDVRRAAENISVELKNISAERDLFRCKVANMQLCIPAGWEGVREGGSGRNKETEWLHKECIGLFPWSADS